MNCLLDDIADDLDLLLSDFGRPVSVDDVELEKALIDDDGAGSDSERCGVTVQVRTLICKASDLERPRDEQVLLVNMEEWTVSKTQILDGFLSIQMFRETLRNV